MSGNAIARNNAYEDSDLIGSLDHGNRLEKGKEIMTKTSLTKILDNYSDSMVNESNK